MVSQGGTSNSAFLLEYQKSGVWKLTTPAADSGTTTYPGAQSTSPVRLNTWTHLAGVYDSAAKTVKLYVNGVLEGTATGVTTWDANGPLHLGGTVPWKGTIGEVQVWDRVLSPSEVFVPGGKDVIASMAVSSASGGRATPSARPTATASATNCR